MSKTDQEKALQYDLLIAPTWRNCFDEMFVEHVRLPTEGRILEVNCGTGGASLELAESVRGRGDVLALDPDPERIAIARAKQGVKETPGLAFEVAELEAMEFDSESFDLVIGDASMIVLTYDIEQLIVEMVRVAKPGGSAVLKLASRGSFDEFFSVFWETLHEGSLGDYSTDVEEMITSRLTVSDAEMLLKHAGLKQVKSSTRKFEMTYPDANSFFTAPLIEDIFLDTWMEVMPDARTTEWIRQSTARLIDRERRSDPFCVSVKATLLWGKK